MYRVLDLSVCLLGALIDPDVSTSAESKARFEAQCLRIDLGAERWVHNLDSQYCAHRCGRLEQHGALDGALAHRHQSTATDGGAP